MKKNRIQNREKWDKMGKTYKTNRPPEFGKLRGKKSKRPGANLRHGNQNSKADRIINPDQRGIKEYKYGPREWANTSPQKDNYSFKAPYSRGNDNFYPKGKSIKNDAMSGRVPHGKFNAGGCPEGYSAGVENGIKRCLADAGSIGTTGKRHIAPTNTSNTGNLVRGYQSRIKK